MIARLILYAHSIGYAVTLGDARRSPQEAIRRGFPRSLHVQGLAVDLNLFKDGAYLSSTEAHRPLGLWWEEEGGTWGGHFGDGNHYSLEHNGVK